MKNNHRKDAGGAATSLYGRTDMSDFLNGLPHVHGPSSKYELASSKALPIMGLTAARSRSGLL